MKRPALEEDRISSLPDCLLIEILSRLDDTKYAIRTGAHSLITGIGNYCFCISNGNSRVPDIDRVCQTTYSPAISNDQKQYLETSGACERQIASIIENMDVKSIEDGNVELNLDQFVMDNLLDAIVSQVMIVLKEKNIPLVHEIPDQVKTLTLVGDQIRFQIVLLVQALTHAKHGVDILSGTRVRTHFARPNWREVFSKVASKNPNTTVGVFYCGMPVLAKELKKLSYEMSSKTSTLFEFHKEYF